MLELEIYINIFANEKKIPASNIINYNKDILLKIHISISIMTQIQKKKCYISLSGFGLP